MSLHCKEMTTMVAVNRNEFVDTGRSTDYGSEGKFQAWRKLCKRAVDKWIRLSSSISAVIQTKLVGG